MRQCGERRCQRTGHWSEGHAWNFLVLTLYKMGPKGKENINRLTLY